jgi:uncharacterized protein YndB with AHSA1/START domain/uncharacterized protein YdhG (YjbR/CyaY superfamily)
MALEVVRHVAAPRAAVYRALLDPAAVQRWMVPVGMTSEVHAFEPREGGAFRISLTYDEPTTAGKTSPQTDTFSGRFTRLVPDEEVVQSVEFESDDPQLRGEMTIRYRLADADGGSTVTGSHEGLPPGVSAADNEIGWGMSMDQLVALVEQLQRMHPDAQAYVAAVAPTHRPLFDRLDRLVVDAYPGARVVLSYKMPTYVVGERRLHVAVWKHGLSLYGWAHGRDAGFAARHPELDSGKGTLKLPLDEAADLADDELRDLVRAVLAP